MPVIIIAIALYILLPSGSIALADNQTHKYTLGELIARTSSYNGEVHEARWRVEGAAAQLRQARAARFLPRLRLEDKSGLAPDAQGDILNPQKDTRLIPELGPFTRIELEFVQPLYTFGQLSSLIDAAEGGLEVEEASLAEKHLDVVFEIQELYYGILQAQDLQNLARRLSDKIDEKRREMDEEEAPLSSTYKLKLAILNLKKQERIIANKLELARDALAWKVGLPPDPPIQLADPGLEPIKVALPPLDPLVSLARANRPDWRKLQSGIQAKDALQKAAHRAYYPQIFLAGGMRYGVAPGRTNLDNPFVDDDYNFFDVGAVVGFRQSFEWGLLGADLDKARAEYHELKAKKSAAEEGIRLEVKRSYVDFKEAAEDLETMRHTRKLTKQWLKEALDAYDLDPDEVKELVRAFEAWAGEEQRYYETVYRFNLSVANLERTIGGISLRKNNDATGPDHR